MNCKDYLNCWKCDRHKTRTNVVWSRGTGSNGLVIVGDSPDSKADEIGYPFMGLSGAMLTKIMDTVNIDPLDCFYVYLVKCYTPGTKPLKKSEIKQCEPYLIEQLNELLAIKLVVCLGSDTAKHLLRLKKFNMKKERGVLHFPSQELSSFPIIVTYHPAFLLRQSSLEVGSPKWYAWQDWKKVKDYIDKCPL